MAGFPRFVRCDEPNEIGLLLWIQRFYLVIPAKAGIHFALALKSERKKSKSKWVPACAGTTVLQ